MIYIGGYENENNQGIYELNDDLSLHKQICDVLGCSYFDVDETCIYTIIKENNCGGIAKYDKKGNLLSKYMTNMKPACFIKKYKNRIYVAYYHDATTQVFDLNLNLLHEFKFEAGSKCHCVIHFKDKFGIINLGKDQIVFYDYEYQLSFKLDFPKNSGPRHACVTKDEQTIFVLSELSNELFIVDMNTRTIVQILPIHENETPTFGAAIRLSKDEKHLYTSTRGQDVLKHFEKKEKWEEVQSILLSGNHPRDFQLFEDSLVIGYQNTNLVEKIYLDNHMISDRKESVNYNKIVCIK